MRKLFSAIRSGFGFLTTIPVGISMEGIENLMKHIYLFPVIGSIVGIIIGGIGYASSKVLHPLMVSVVIIISIYYLTGINHLDGLADFGDGAVAHATREEKIAAMKDTALGTGGLIFCMSMILGVFASLYTIAESNVFESNAFLPYVLIVAEISAKQSMVTIAVFGKRIYEGFGAITVENAKLSDLIIGMIFSSIVSYFLLGIKGLLALLFSQLFMGLLLYTANRNFGGVNGDVVGASNEIGRMVALFFMGGMVWMHL